ncbi:MAG: GNAT family N-acetyltransferase [Sandaracinus sp.]|nr:GNAT family N-acetyltransferase [Sandaracinus sp.]
MSVVLRSARPHELDAMIAIDDAASTLFHDAGLVVDLGPEHPFVREENARWARAIEAGHAVVAVEDGTLSGFATFGAVDGAAYLDQLAVHPLAMRRGLGTRLLHHVVDRARGPLWLTTYAHLAWNGPYYARHGFVRQAEDSCGPELLAILASQRAVLPLPEQRIAMRRPTEAP